MKLRKRLEYPENFQEAYDKLISQEIQIDDFMIELGITDEEHLLKLFEQYKKDIETKMKQERKQNPKYLSKKSYEEILIDFKRSIYFNSIISLKKAVKSTYFCVILISFFYALQSVCSLAFLLSNKKDLISNWIHFNDLHYIIFFILFFLMQAFCCKFWRGYHINSKEFKVIKPYKYLIFTCILYGAIACLNMIYLWNVLKSNTVEKIILSIGFSIPVAMIGFILSNISGMDKSLTIKEILSKKNT